MKSSAKILTCLNGIAKLYWAHGCSAKICKKRKAFRLGAEAKSSIPVNSFQFKKTTGIAEGQLNGYESETQVILFL